MVYFCTTSRTQTITDNINKNVFFPGFRNKEAINIYARQDLRKFRINVAFPHRSVQQAHPKTGFVSWPYWRTSATQPGTMKAVSTYFVLVLVTVLTADAFVPGVVRSSAGHATTLRWSISCYSRPVLSVRLYYCGSSLVIALQALFMAQLLSITTVWWLPSWMHISFCCGICFTYCIILNKSTDEHIFIPGTSRFYILSWFMIGAQ